jgi:hypothetical protein
MNNKWLAFFILFLAPWAMAQSHKGISFQGVIKLPSGEYPTRSGLTVTSRILSPNNCILREEQFTGVNVANGYINIAIGAGSTGGYDPGFTMKQVMDNSAVINGLTCLNADGTVNGGVVSFNPATTTGARKFRLNVEIDSIPVIADFNMRAMAYAINSETLNGKTETNFINTSANITQAAVENWFASAVMGQINSGTYVAPSATTATTATTAGNVTGTVAIANGGTGATSAVNALTNLLPTQTTHAGKVLTTNGGSVSWTAFPSAPVASVAGKTGAVSLVAADISDLNNAVDARVGAMTAADIPGLDAAKIISGTLTQNVSATSVSGTTGSFTNLRIYDGASQYLTMTLPTGGTGYALKWPSAVGSNGQVLRTDASGNLSWYSVPGVASIGGDLSGSLPNPSVVKIQGKDVAPAAYAAGQALRYDGAKWTNDLLDFGDLSGSVASAQLPTVPISKGGTGVTSLTANRLLASDGTGSTVTPFNCGVGQLLTFDASGVMGCTAYSSSGFFANDGNSFGAAANLGTNDGFDLNLKTNNTTKVTVSAAGFVGLGTTTPQALLHLSSSSTAFQEIKVDAARNSSGAYGLTFAKSRGVMTGRTATQADDVLGDINFIGWSAAGDYTPSSVRIRAHAAEIPSATSSAGHLAFQTTPTGSILAQERMRISSSGNVGIGTDNPLATLHIVSTQPNTVVHPDRAGFVLESEGTSVGGRIASKVYSSTETPLFVGYRARGTKAAPTALLNGDIVMSLAPVGYDGSGGWQTGAHVRFLTTENWSPTTIGSAISFRTPENGTVAALERMRIDNTGYVGLGTSAPAANLHVYGASSTDVSSFLINSNDTDAASRAIFLLGTSASGTRYGYISHQSASYTPAGAMQPRTTVVAGTDTGGLNFLANSQIGFWTGATEKMRLSVGGNLGIGMTPTEKLDVNGGVRGTSAYQSTSDVRYKKNIETISDALDKILLLRGVTFDWRTDEFRDKNFKSTRDMGVIAQEVEKVFPEAVLTDKDGYKSVAYSELVAPLINAVKELYSRNQNLEKENAQKNAEIQIMKDYLCAKDPGAPFCSH